jgi:hypothetical protein
VGSGLSDGILKGNRLEELLDGIVAGQNLFFRLRLFMDESDHQDDTSLAELIKSFQEGRATFEQVRAKMATKQAQFPKIFQALGELAVESAQLESELTITLCELVVGPMDPKRVNVEVVNAIAQERRSFPVLANLVKKLFNAYIKDEERRKPFHATLGEAMKLMEERGSRIHGFWSLDYSTDKVAYFAHKAVRESVNPEDIEAIVKKVKDCKGKIYSTFVKAFGPPAADNSGSPGASV